MLISEGCIDVCGGKGSRCIIVVLLMGGGDVKLGVDALVSVGGARSSGALLSVMKRVRKTMEVLFLNLNGV